MKEPRLLTLRSLAAVTGLSILALTSPACTRDNRPIISGDPVVRSIPTPEPELPIEDQVANTTDYRKSLPVGKVIVDIYQS